MNSESTAPLLILKEEEKMQHLKVSIITPTFNAQETLQETIKSVQKQNWPNIEHIIVDGASTDRTMEIVEQYYDHFAKIISERDAGIYDAMNKGVSVAQGDLIGILNADDQYSPSTVHDIAKSYMFHGEKLVVLYGDMVQYNSYFEGVFCGDMSIRAFRCANIKINHPTCFVSRGVYERIGGFDTSFTAAADREFMYRAFKAGVRFIKLEKVLSFFRLGGYTSSYTLKRIFKGSVEEFKLHKRHQSFWLGVTKSGVVFLRLLRNWLCLKIISKNRSEKLRATFLSKKCMK